MSGLTSDDPSLIDIRYHIRHHPKRGPERDGVFGLYRRGEGFRHPDRMAHVHAIVWLDHRDARVIGFSMGAEDSLDIHSELPERPIRHRDRVPGEGHTNNDLHFFAEIAEALDGAHEVLITGPGTAKTALENYIQQRHPDLAGRIVGVEPLDHPSEGQLLAFARTYFKRTDQLGGV
jgi:hypothetical protein